MASKYDGLDAVTGLEQAVFADLERAFKPRGCKVIHNGSATSCAPGGKSDLELHDGKRLLLHIEVTKRKGAAADGEFAAITDHLNKAVEAGGFKDYCCLYVSPGTSARMSANIRNLYNRAREREKKQGRVLAIDFTGLETLTQRLASSDPKLYPAERLSTLFARAAEAIDDLRARKLVADVLLTEDENLTLALTEEMRRRDAEREQRLKAEIRNLEDQLRHNGITGNDANETLIYLTFLRLYEEKKEQEARGKHINRFTRVGFDSWAAAQLAQVKVRHQERMVEILLRELAEDKELKAAGLLQVKNGQKDRLHGHVTDTIVRDEVLRVFDDYEFYGSSVDVLGVVFETLARRGEKDTRIGQFFTPQAVVDFCTDLVDLRPRDVVLDPAVGTSRFLIAAMSRMLERVDEVPEPRERVVKAIQTKQLLGVDLDAWVATIAKMNMYIHGDGKGNVLDGNGLILGDRPVLAVYPKGIAEQIDVVLTNPPLGNTSFKAAASHWAKFAASPPSEADSNAFLGRLGTVPMHTEASRQERVAERLAAAVRRATARVDALAADTSTKAGKLAAAKTARDTLVSRLAAARSLVVGPTPPVPEGEKLKGGALFLGAIASYLKRVRDANERVEWQGGRAVVVVDEAILNTVEFKTVRDFIRQQYFIKAVISLGRPAFKYLAHTDAKTSILYLIRKPNNDLTQREPILFAHAERVGYSATGKWIGNDLPRVLEHVRAAQEAVRSSYRGASFDKPKCVAKLTALPQYQSLWHARFQDGASDRLDYFYARYLDLSEALYASGLPVVTLGDLIEPREVEHPEPSPTNEYEFAVVERVGVISAKGSQEVKYRPEDLWIVREGDIAISGIDLIHGAAAVAGADVADLVMSKEMMPYRIKVGASGGGALPDYVVVVMRTSAVRAMILGVVSGTSNRTRVTQAGEILGVPVLAPPDLIEQEKVVELAREAARYRREAEVKLAQAAERVLATWPLRRGGDA